MNAFAQAARPRALFLAGIAVIVTLFATTGWLVIARRSPPNAAAAVEKTVATLNIARPNFEMPGEKAARVREAVRRSDYAAARKTFEGILASSPSGDWKQDPFDSFITVISDVVDPTFAARLDAWVSLNSKDAVPLLLRAQYYADLGWFRRGHRFVKDVQPDALAAFQDDMRKAFADVDASIRLDDGIPYAFYLKLRILQGAGASSEVAEVFEHAIAKHPSYYPLYSIVLRTLEPKWGGSVSQMYAFVDGYAGRAGEYSPLKLLYLDLYRSLLDAASTDCSGKQHDQATLAECVAADMADWVTPELEKNVVAALQLYDHSDHYEFGAAVGSILAAMLQTAGGDSHSGAILQLTATAMHSNTQLKQETPGNNDYVIDQLVARSWFLKGFYDNALAKDHEAVRDIDAAKFSSEEKRDLARARVYEDIARAYNKLHRYADMISYEEAAVAVGNATGNEHFICYGYYSLKDYDRAVRACDKAIADQPGNLFAYYWRGSAYRDSGRTDEALRDLTVVANSEDRFRAGAAIDMSMIHFGRKDVRGALDVLNRYAYLYDPSTTSRNDVAVSYNNRCYAYMELGDLKKALDDCTQSLRYGSLPDAFRKQQELVKRLGRT